MKLTCDLAPKCWRGCVIPCYHMGWSCDRVHDSYNIPRQTCPGTQTIHQGRRNVNTAYLQISICRFIKYLQISELVGLLNNHTLKISIKDYSIITGGGLEWGDWSGGDLCSTNTYCLIKYCLWASKENQMDKTRDQKNLKTIVCFNVHVEMPFYCGKTKETLKQGPSF